MKLFLLLYTVCFLSIANAQNWKPIIKGEVRNYVINNDSSYISIWVDSVAKINNDSVFYLNRIARKIKQSTSSWGYNATYLKNAESYLLSAIVYSNNTIRVQHNASMFYVINTNVLLNDIWVINPANNDTARVIGVAKAKIMEQYDSIKIITINKTDTIILSKNYGVIKFPMFDVGHNHINLISIQERNVGLLMPMFDNVFDFSVGDVFYYKTALEIGGKAGWQNTDSYEKRIITSKLHNDNTYTYTANVISVNHTSFRRYNLTGANTGGSTSGNTTTFNENNNVSFSISDTVILSMYPNEIKNNILAICKYNTSLNCIQKQFPSIYYSPSTNFDTLISHENVTFPVYNSSVYYGNGVGLIYYSDINRTGYSANNFTRELIGGIKNGKPYGKIYSDAVFINWNSKNSFSTTENISAYVYPNPFSGAIKVDYQLLKDSRVKITLTNNLGEIIEQPLDEYKDKGDHTFIHNMPQNCAAGMYFLHITDDANTSIYKKINYIKQ